MNIRFFFLAGAGRMGQGRGKGYTDLCEKFYSLFSMSIVKSWFRKEYEIHF